jgi:hypothetical protein
MPKDDFTAWATPQRGMLTNVRTGASLRFPLNPTKIPYKSGSNTVKDSIPGFSDPIVKWASGKEKSIKLSLHLDAIWSYEHNGGVFANAADPKLATAAAQGVLTIQGELAFLEQFYLPVHPDEAPGNYGPDLVSLTYGPMFGGIICMADGDFSVDITCFTSHMEPSVADVEMTLVRVVAENVYAGSVWRGA